MPNVPGQHQIAAAILLTALALSPAACGDEESPGTSAQSPATTPSDTQGTTAAPKPPGTNCPLAEEQVSDAFGVRMPKIPETPCGFGNAQDGPVVVPFPASPDAAQTLSEYRGALPPEDQGRVLDRPAWGRDALILPNEGDDFATVDALAPSISVTAKFPSAQYEESERIRIVDALMGAVLDEGA